MNRLFLHLYIVIVCGLLFINWLSELLWQQFVHQENVEWSYVSEMARVIPDLISADNTKLEQVKSTLDISLAIIAVDDIAWLDEQKQRLLSGKTVSIYDEKDNVMLYVKASDKADIYRFGPFERQRQALPQHQFLKRGFLLVSYLLLAGIIALWARPLWRDLKQLTFMASEIGDGKLDVTVYKNTQSPIGSVVITFRDMAHRIIRLLSDQKQLVNAVSHELRTPLSRLRFSLVLLEGVSAEQREEMEQDISEMETLIDEMLGYARLENVNQEINKTPVDLVALIDNQVAKLTRLSDLNIQWQLPEYLEYSCNEKLVERAMQNLATNALRYAKKNIRISLVMNQQTIEFVVEDDGEGICESEQERIFEPFFRLDKSRSKYNGGYGLGLAIVKRICQWHKASCHLSRSDLGGCRFVLNFPNSS